MSRSDRLRSHCMSMMPNSGCFVKSVFSLTLRKETCPLLLTKHARKENVMQRSPCMFYSRSNTDHINDDHGRRKYQNALSVFALSGQLGGRVLPHGESRQTYDEAGKQMGHLKNSVWVWRKRTCLSIGERSLVLILYAWKRTLVTAATCAPITT